MTEPVETPKRLYRKAARGKDAESMPIVFGGVILVISIAVLVLLTVTFLVYFLA